MEEMKDLAIQEIERINEKMENPDMWIHNPHSDVNESFHNMKEGE